MNSKFHPSEEPSVRGREADAATMPPSAIQLGASAYLSRKAQKSTVDGTPEEFASPIEISQKRTANFILMCGSHGSVFDRFSSILRLLLSRCPSAISWLVVAVIVWPTVKAFLLRTDSHVRQKVQKRHPPFADLNAASAIVFVSLVFAICASLNHASPRVVGGGNSNRFSGMSMTDGISTGKAAAATDSPRCEMMPHYDFLVSADASTQPELPSLIVESFLLKCGQISKGLAYSIGVIHFDHCIANMEVGKV